METIRTLQRHIQQMLARIMRRVVIVVVAMIVIGLRPVRMLVPMKMHLRRQMHRNEIEIKRGQCQDAPAPGMT